MQKFLKIFLLVLLLCNSSTAVFAEMTAEQLEKARQDNAKAISENAISECRKTLTSAYDLEIQAFLEFLEANFQNKSSNSSLTNIAISRYAELKTRMEDLYQLLTPNLPAGSSSAEYQFELAAYETCSDIKTTYIAAAKQKMIEHIRNTSAQKKTTVLLEKYQAINNELRDLNLALAQMYGFFGTFKEKLPSFTQYCQKSFGS